MKTLEDILAGRVDPQLPVFIDDTAAVTGSMLTGQAASAAETFLAHPGKRWAIHTSSTGHFCASFLGLLAADKDILVLPSNLPALLDEVAPMVDGFVLDAHRNGPLPCITPNFEAGTAKSFSLSDRPERITFYTSGTTGRGKAIPKTLQQVQSEVHVHEKLWGGLLGDAATASSVSHQHIYGFLFAFLWPLLAGRTFRAESVPLLLDLGSFFESQTGCAFISCPAHLKRFPELTDMEEHAETLRAVFSSGGPLPQATALRIADILGHAPIEVFGSTETGGVAIRQRSRQNPEPSWQCMPGLETRLDEPDHTLAVRSPFTADTWISMGDHAVLEDHAHFRIMGRSDRIVKIEQKRISLDQAEAWLLTSDLVADAGLLPLEEDSYRDLLGAAVQLSEKGLAHMNANGRKVVVNDLKKHMGQRFEAVTLPRKWLFPETLPRNSQGKLPRSALAALFSPERPWRPHVIEEQKDGNSVQLRGQVPGDLVFFDGHFDRVSIVPGVAQLHWALLLAEEYFGMNPGIEKMEAVKFHNLMFPDEPFELNLQWHPENRKLSFSYQHEGRHFSSGRFLLEA